MSRYARLVVLGVAVSMLFAAAAMSAPTVADKNFVYDDHGRRDPFGKLVSPNGVILTHEKDLTTADLALEGILADPSGKNIAIINSRVLRENDMLGAFKVIKITVDAVTLQKAGQGMITLKLKKEE